MGFPPAAPLRRGSDAPGASKADVVKSHSSMRVCLAPKSDRRSKSIPRHSDHPASSQSVFIMALWLHPHESSVTGSKVSR
jgi:hypothetical protein